MSGLLDTIRSTPWLRLKSRRMESIVARLRIGHVGVRSHLKRFNMSETGECDRCDEEETVEHFLMICPTYGLQREHLMRRFRNIGVQFTIKNVLCFGNETAGTLQLILEALVEFIKSSGRMHEL